MSGPATNKDRVTVALLGCGTVGGGVLELLHTNAARLAARVGAPIEIKYVVVRDLNKPRVAACRSEWLIRDANAALADPEVDLVVELVGGESDALGYIQRAILAGKSVVTANKLVLATRGPELLGKAVRAGVDLAFEGAVGGGIPIVRTLREAFASDRVETLVGIVNGTSNYILSEMLDGGLSFERALGEAQRLGYAEADPTMDVGGFDAAHKLNILALLAFAAQVEFEQIHVEGIGAIEAIDHRFAERFGYCIKHLVIGRDHGDSVELRAHPALIDRRSVLANVSGVLNAVLLNGAALGPSLVYGRGAGALPTAVSVVSDIIDVARSVRAGVQGLTTSGIGYARRPLRPLAELMTRYYIRFSVRDEPGVMAALAGSLGRQQVSIEQMVQDGRAPQAGEPATVVMLTHKANEGAVQAAVDELSAASFMVEPPRLLRIEAV